MTDMSDPGFNRADLYAATLAVVTIAGLCAFWRRGR